MIYSISHDFVFLHCPRTSGTAITKALSILVPDAVSVEVMKHCVFSELPSPVQQLRAFTVQRPFDEVRRSYYRYITQWYREADDNTFTTIWLLKHAERLSKMSLEEYLVSEEPPLSVNGYTHGCSEVFQYNGSPYDRIAAFCGVDRVQFGLLVEAFRGLTS